MVNPEFHINDFLAVYGLGGYTKAEVTSMTRELLVPLTKLNRTVQADYYAARDKLLRTGQVIVMQAALNDVFDPIDRGIQVVTTAPGTFEVRIPTALKVTGDALNRLEGLVDSMANAAATYTTTTI